MNQIYWDYRAGKTTTMEQLGPEVIVRTKHGDFYCIDLDTGRVWAAKQVVEYEILGELH